MNTDDFVFAWEDEGATPEPLRVAKFVGEEAMSRLFRYEILLLAKEADLDPETFIGKRASLWIATLSAPAWKVVHGVVTEAEDATAVPEGSVYRVVLEPPLSRARHRTRSRIFLDKTLRQILESVLRDDAGMTLTSGASLEPPVGPPSYTAAATRFTFRIKGKRLDDPKARPYVVQYNESDLDFASRLLEEEGISYHFEHTDDASLLVLSDKDFGRTRVPGDDVFGPGKPGHGIGTFRLGARLREKAVRLGAYSWEKPALDVGAEALSGDAGDLSVYTFHGGFFESTELGRPLAEARLDELHTEASSAVGEGVTRLLSAGSIFTLEHPKPRYEGEYLVTRLHALGHQQGVLSVDPGSAPAEPFRVEIECACRGRGSDVAESRYRPARRTRKPRILGSQTAFVTAEPSARGSEVNLGGPSSIGCVRLRFHWDTEEKRLGKEPSSKWVRVSEPFARGGQGGIWHPRVGCEVIVEFEDGDPDRPFVTGRVYNGKNRPAQTNPTHSTMWSLSTPGAGVRNEISFEDTAGSERIYTNAGKDMVTNVGNERAENVGADALMTVGANNVEAIGGNQTIQIGGNDTLSVGGNQTETIGANQVRVIGGNRLMVIGGNETRQTGAAHVNIVGGALSETVAADVSETYGATRSTSIAADWTENYGATRDQTVGAITLQDYGGNQTTNISGARTINAGAVLGAFVGGNVDTQIGGSETVNVGAATIHVAGGPITHQASSMDINMLLKLHLVGVKLNMYVVKAEAVGRSSSSGVLTASAKGTSITFTGVSIRNIKLKATAAGAKLDESGVKFVGIGVLIHPSGMHTFT